MDEHRLGLKPIVRRVWARRGQRPQRRVQQRYQWRSLYAFVRPTTGESHWLILPTVNTDVFTLARAHFANEVGAGPRKRIVFVLDQAGYHTSGEVRVPAGSELEFLPAYSPEVQPAERLWPLTNEGVANTWFADLDALEAVLARRCVVLAEQPELIHSYTWYHWWPEGA